MSNGELSAAAIPPETLRARAPRLTSFNSTFIIQHSTFNTPLSPFTLFTLQYYRTTGRLHYRACPTHRRSLPPPPVYGPVTRPPTASRPTRGTPWPSSRLFTSSTSSIGHSSTS